MKYTQIDIRKILLLHIIIFSIFSLPSCKKKQGEWTTNIEGAVTDYYTGDSLSFILITIEECKTPLVTTTFCGIIDSTHTTASGFYNHSVIYEYPDHSGTMLEYQISVPASENYAHSNVFEFEEEGTYHFNFRVKPYHRIRIILNDSAGVCDNIVLSIGAEETANNYYFRQELSVSNLSGLDTVLMKCVPEENHYVSCRKYSNSQTMGHTSFNKYIGIADTTDIIINY